MNQFEFPKLISPQLLRRCLSSMEKRSHSIPIWWSFCLIVGGAFAWKGRNVMCADGISYLDMASGILNGQPSTLVNGYWSPGYPAILGLVLSVFHPAPTREFVVLHFANFLIFGTAVAGFTFFLSNLSRQIATTVRADRGWLQLIIPFAFSTFLWFMVEFIGLDLATPDLAVAAIVFVAAGIATAVSASGSKWHEPLLLGFVLGIGYYIKAAMLPIGLSLLVILFFAAPLSGWNRRKVFVSAVALAVTIAPLIVMISKKVGRISLGETAQLNYAWYVDQVPGVSRIGDLTTYGNLSHPPRKLIETPLTLEFAAPVGGTYPLWFDPSYWYAGLKLRINPILQIKTISNTLREYNGFFFRMMAFIAGALTLYLLSLREQFPRLSNSAVSWQWLWPVAACSIYALVHVEDRFVAPFLVLFWLAIYRTLLYRCRMDALTAVIAVLVFFTVGSVVWDLQPDRFWTSERIMRDQRVDTGFIVDNLSRCGIQTGDRIAFVGSGFYPWYEYPFYARMARIQVIAQIPHADEFWRLNDDELSLLKSRLAAIGVRAIIATSRPYSSNLASWQDINEPSGLRLSVLLLRPKDKPPD